MYRSCADVAVPEDSSMRFVIMMPDVEEVGFEPTNS